MVRSYLMLRCIRPADWVTPDSALLFGLDRKYFVYACNRVVYAHLTKRMGVPDITVDVIGHPHMSGGETCRHLSEIDCNSSEPTRNGVYLLEW